MINDKQSIHLFFVTGRDVISSVVVVVVVVVYADGLGLCAARPYKTVYG